MNKARRTLERAFMLVVWMAVVLNTMKGLPHFISEMGFPYWTMTYDDGFIRRGLIGTLVHELFAGFDPENQRKKILALHVAMAFTFCALLFVWARKTSRQLESSHARTLVMTGTAALLLSQFPSTTVALAGYLDIFLFFLCIGVAYYADQRKYRLAGVLAAIGPVVHDAFLFLWAPIAIIAARRILRVPRERRRAELRRYAPLASPLVTAALTMALHSPSAAQSQIAKAPTGWDVQESFRLYQFGLTIKEALVVMGRKYVAIPDQFLLACAFFLPAIAVTAACAYGIDRDTIRWRRALFTIVVTLSPCAVLLIAWDLSRFLLWAGMGAFLLLMANAADSESTKADEARSDAPLTIPTAFALAACVLLSTGPSLYAYFEMTFADYPWGPSIFRSSPGAKISYAFMKIYNRRLFIRDWATNADGKCSADAPGIERLAQCSFLVRPGQYVESKELWLGPGTFEATIETSPSEACGSTATPIGGVTPHVIWRFGGFRPETRFTVKGPTTTTVTFSITEEESGMGRAKVRVWGREGCFRVDSIHVVQKDAR